MRCFGLAVWALVMTGCDEKRPPPAPDFPPDAGYTCDGSFEPPPAVPGADTDGDGTPDDRDDDADGDGLDNSLENTGGPTCLGLDVDGDGTPNWLDRDSDGDLLADMEERPDSDPFASDTDADGSSDLIEREGARSDPRDPTKRPPPSSVEIRLGGVGSTAEHRQTLLNRVDAADVFLLVDTTGTMREERTELIRGLVDTIIPGLRGTVSDLRLGAGGLDDYPVSGYGQGDDRPFYLLTTMIDPDQDLGDWSLAADDELCPNGIGFDVGTITGSPNGRPDILDAIEGLPCHDGLDLPESFVPALWATATGNGLMWSGGGFVEPQTSCDASDGIPRAGYPCFRESAQPIVVLVGDDDFHNGPGDTNQYVGIDAPTYLEAVAALGGIGAKVIAVFSGASMEALADFTAIAQDTDAIYPDGRPMVFEIMPDGSGLSGVVVSAVEALAEGQIQDIELRAQSGAGNPDDYDAARFVQSIVATMATGGVTGMDGATFRMAQPGASMEWVIRLENRERAPGPRVQVFTLYLRAYGSAAGRAIASRVLYIVVPPA